jgi:hypothetical protein
MTFARLFYLFYSYEVDRVTGDRKSQRGEKDGDKRKYHRYNDRER